MQLELKTQHELQLPRQARASVRGRGIVAVTVEVHRAIDDAEV